MSYATEAPEHPESRKPGPMTDTEFTQWQRTNSLKNARLHCSRIKHPDQWLNRPQKRLGMDGSFDDELCNIFHLEQNDGSEHMPGSATLAYCRLMTGSNEDARELRYALASKIYAAYGEEIAAQQSAGEPMRIDDPEDDSYDAAAEEAWWEGLREKIRERAHGMAELPGCWQVVSHHDLCIESFDHAMRTFIEAEAKEGSDREPDSLTQQYCRLVLSDAGRELREMVFAHIAEHHRREAGSGDWCSGNWGAADV